MAFGVSQHTPLWTGPGDPPDDIAATFKTTREKAKRALYDIKQRGGLDDDDVVSIHPNGDVITTQDDRIGNLKHAVGV